MKSPFKFDRAWVEEAVIHIVMYGIPLFGATVAVLAARHHFALSVWSTIGIGIIGACGTTVPFLMWLNWREAKEMREFQQTQIERKIALERWQERFCDPVFGIPGYDWLPGQPQDLEDYSGMVPVAPKEPNDCSARITVHITPDGFTESQRQFYLKVIHDFPGLMKQIHPAISSAFYREFPNAGEFPREVGLHSMEIGRERDGKLEKTILTFEYEQDEYVTIDFTENRVNSIEFYM
jgi:hypothetical protein